MPAAPATHLHLTPAELGVGKVGHFSWVKRPQLVLPRIEAWIRQLR